VADGCEVGDWVTVGEERDVGMGDDVGTYGEGTGPW